MLSFTKIARIGLNESFRGTAILSTYQTTNLIFEGWDDFVPSCYISRLNFAFSRHQQHIYTHIYRQRNRFMNLVRSNQIYVLIYDLYVTIVIMHAVSSWWNCLLDVYISWNTCLCKYYIYIYVCIYIHKMYVYAKQLATFRSYEISTKTRGTSAWEAGVSRHHWCPIKSRPETLRT